MSRRRKPSRQVIHRPSPRHNALERLFAAVCIREASKILYASEGLNVLYEQQIHFLHCVAISASGRCEPHTAQAADALIKESGRMAALRRSQGWNGFPDVTTTTVDIAPVCDTKDVEIDGEPQQLINLEGIYTLAFLSRSPNAERYLIGVNAGMMELDCPIPTISEERT